MKAADRIVVVAIAFMFAAIPLYGTFQVFDALRAPMPVLVGFHGALAIAFAMLLAAGCLRLGRVPAPRSAPAGYRAGAAGVGDRARGAARLRRANGARTRRDRARDGRRRDRRLRLCAAARRDARHRCGDAGGGDAGITARARHAALAAYRRRYMRTTTRAPVGLFLNPNELAAYLLVVLGLAAGVVLLHARSRAADPRRG